MSDIFIRYIDNSVIWRADDEIKLSIPRAQYCYDHIDIGSDWCKTGDAPLYRRPDEATITRLPDYPLSRIRDNPIATRLPGEDHFIRSA